MKKLLATLITALFATVAYSALAADPVKTGPTDKPGRAIDDGTVKSGGATDKPGRAVDDSSTVKSGGATDKPGRTVDEQKKATKKKKKKEPQS
jgi:hypothetical protein